MTRILRDDDSPVWRRRRRVLLVAEPSRDVASARAALASAGYETESAAGGAEALGLLADEGRLFDAVVVGGGVAPLCGDDVAGLVAGFRPDVAVLVVPDVGARDVVSVVEAALEIVPATVRLVPPTPPAWARARRIA